MNAHDPTFLPINGSLLPCAISSRVGTTSLPSKDVEMGSRATGVVVPFADEYTGVGDNSVSYIPAPAPSMSYDANSQVINNNNDIKEYAIVSEYIAEPVYAENNDDHFSDLEIEDA